MSSNQFSINIDFRIKIDSPKVQYYILACPFFRSPYDTMIPNMIDKIFMFYPGQLTFRRKRNCYFTAESCSFMEFLFHPNICKIKGIVPFSI